MKAPALPRTDATETPTARSEGASNEEQFGSAAIAPPVITTGWDPYEVWRTRVFAAQPTSYNKGRGNT
jgi:hypothetical protein